MSDPIKKVKKSVQIILTFDPVKYRADPFTCVSYDIKSGEGTEVGLPEWSAVELSLRTVLSKVVKPKIKTLKRKSRLLLK